MTFTLAQKILAATAILSTVYSTIIFVVYYDLMRPLSKSIAQLLPGLIIFCFGIAASILFNYPNLVFKQFFPVKSGFAKGVIGTVVFPLVGSSIRTITIIGGISALIDKMWFYWRGKRIYFFVRMMSVVSMAIIVGNTLFKFIFTDQKKLVKAISKLNKVGAWAASLLGALLVLVTIMAIPKLFARTPSNPPDKTPDDTTPSDAV